MSRTSAIRAHDGTDTLTYVRAGKILSHYEEEH